MNRNSKPIFMYFIIVFALLTANISPACKFISGKQNDFIEICTAFGTELISISEENESTQPKNKLTKQCLFCFFAQTHKVVINKGLDFNLTPYKIKIINLVFADKILHSQQIISFEARAPPYIS